jgi:hypothetical protein
MQRRIVLLVCVAALATIALPAATAGALEPPPAGKTYKMRRAALSATFVVREGRVIYYAFEPLMRCDEGHGSYIGFDADTTGPNYQRNGRFVEKSDEGPSGEDALVGRIHQDEIVGTFRRWYAGEDLSYRCGTGSPRGNKMHFVADLARR